MADANRGRPGGAFQPPTANSHCRARRTSPDLNPSV